MQFFFLPVVRYKIAPKHVRVQRQWKPLYLSGVKPKKKPQQKQDLPQRCDQCRSKLDKSTLDYERNLLSLFLMSARVKGGVLAWEWEVGGAGGDSTGPPPSLGLARGPPLSPQPTSFTLLQQQVLFTHPPTHPTLPFPPKNKVCFVLPPPPPPTTLWPSLAI